MPLCFIFISFMNLWTFLRVDFFFFFFTCFMRAGLRPALEDLRVDLCNMRLFSIVIL
jgi:hypothetical protein